MSERSSGTGSPGSYWMKSH